MAKHLTYQKLVGKPDGARTEEASDEGRGRRQVEAAPRPNKRTTKEMTVAGFSSARELLGWALEGLNHFQSLSETTFGRRDSYTQIKEFNADRTEITFKLRAPPVPQELRKLATHVLWDIKHALDHATYAAVSAVLESDPGDVHFPVASHPNDLLVKITGPKSKFPVELQPTFQGFEGYPTGSGYPGGNDIVVAFNKLANNSKHAVSLRAFTAAGLHRAQGQGKIGGAVLFPNGIAFNDDELVLGVFPFDPDMEMNLDLSILVSFGDVELLEGRRADEMLGVYGAYAKRFIDKLDTDVAAILAARA